MIGPRTVGAAMAELAIPHDMPAHLARKVRLVRGLQVPIALQGQGIGSKLLTAICAEADAEHMTLILEPKPFGQTNMDEQALNDWYARYGFKPLQETPITLMVRQCSGK